jgi:hypothetical protein
MFFNATLSFCSVSLVAAHFSYRVKMNAKFVAGNIDDLSARYSFSFSAAV